MNDELKQCKYKYISEYFVLPDILQLQYICGV